MSLWGRWVNDRNKTAKHSVSKLCMRGDISFWCPVISSLVSNHWNEALQCIIHLATNDCILLRVWNQKLVFASCVPSYYHNVSEVVIIIVDQSVLCRGCWYLFSAQAFVPICLHRQIVEDEHFKHCDTTPRTSIGTSFLLFPSFMRKLTVEKVE